MLTKEEKFQNQVKKLMQDNGINEIHAGCFISNYYDPMYCGQCKSKKECEGVYNDYGTVD